MKRWLGYSLIAIIVVVLAGQVLLVSAQVSERPIRVGLYYGSNTLPEVRLSSAGGLLAGYLASGSEEVIPLVEHSASASWDIRHEAFRVEFGPYDSLVSARAMLAGLTGDLKFIVAEGGRYYVRYGAYPTAEMASTVQRQFESSFRTCRVYGAFRLTSGPQPSQADAIALRNELRDSGMRAIMAWNRAGWQVWVGSEASGNAALALVEVMPEQFADIDWQLVSPTRRSEVYSVEGELLLVAAEDVYIRAMQGVGGHPPLVTITVNNRALQYKGYMQLVHESNNSFKVINFLSMDDYVMGVVPREMPLSFPTEALKAQAVIARTYAEANRGRFASQGFDLCPTVNSQVYGDYSWESSVSRQVVLDTAGEVVTYGGRVIATYYHSDGGGHTENVENVWVTPFPYLVGVPELYPSSSPNATWEVVLSPAEIRSLLAQQNINIGTILRVEALSYTPAGRVVDLQITGTHGTHILNKEQTRLRDLNSSLVYRLRSRRYTVVPNIPRVNVLGADGKVVALNPHGLAAVSASGTGTLARNDSYTLLGERGIRHQSSAQATDFLFVGSGFGHGVGLSQWGARAMAENGHTYIEILEHYYRGIRVERVGR